MGTQAFIGGLRLLPAGTVTPRDALGLVWGWHFNATRPLAELVVGDERVLLRLRGAWIRRFARAFFFAWATEWEAPRAGVTAEAFGRGFMGTRGVLLKAPGQASAIFWCDGWTQRAVLAAFQA